MLATSGYRGHIDPPNKQYLYKIHPRFPTIFPLKYLLYIDKAPYIAPRYAAYDTLSSKN